MSVYATYFLPHAPILISNIGNNQTEQAQKTVTALERISNEIAKINPDTIVIISPHGPIFNDAISIYQLNHYRGDFEQFGVKELAVSFEKDDKFIEALLKENDSQEGLFYPLLDQEFEMFQQFPKLDHGILVPMYFLKKAGVQSKIVCMSYGIFSYEKLMEHGLMIHKTSEALNQKTLIISSGDLSHTLTDCGPCAYHSSGEKLDLIICEAFENHSPYAPFLTKNSLIMEAEICGLNPFAIGIGAFIGRGIESTLLSYEGPFGVGYMVASIKENKNAPLDHYSKFKIQRNRENAQKRLEEHFYAKIARACIVHFQNTQRVPRTYLTSNGVKVENQFFKFPFDVFESDLRETSGIFVTLMHMGNLKGCMGCVRPNGQQLLDLLVDFSINAYAFDSRFEPLDPQLIDELEVHVEILSPLEKVLSKEDLDPKAYGIFIEGKGRHGVLLPNIHGIGSVDEQLTIACNKVGIRVDEIETMHRFSTSKYE